MPAIAAIFRSQLASGLKGDGPAQRAPLRMIEAIEGDFEAKKTEFLKVVIDYKADAEREIERRRKLRITDISDIDPHPDDLLVDMATGEVHVKDELDAALGRVWVERQADLKEEGRALLAFEPGSETMEVYQTQMDGFFEKFEDLDQTALAQYVIHRRIVLNLLEQALRRDDDTGRYQLEAVVHRLIHPIRKGSDEIEFEEQNLWILDDRLTYHDFMESDKELRVSDCLENKSQTRPDLLVVFDRTLTFREGRDLTTSFVIVEFKKPDRRSFERSPVAQVYDQVRDIRAGKFKDRNGRPVEGTSKDLQPSVTSCATSWPRLSVGQSTLAGNSRLMVAGILVGIPS
jgi:hypothetical protein